MDLEVKKLKEKIEQANLAKQLLARDLDGRLNHSAMRGSAMSMRDFYKAGRDDDSDSAYDSMEDSLDSEDDAFNYSGQKSAAKGRNKKELYATQLRKTLGQKETKNKMNQSFNGSISQMSETGGLPPSSAN